MNNPFITYICLHTHDCGDLPWFKGAGFYVCTPGTQNWSGPYTNTETARQEHGNIRCHSPALGSRSGS